MVSVHILRGNNMKNVHWKSIGGVTSLLFGILLCSPPSAESQIRVTTLAAPVNTLTITDLDYLNATTPKWLFTITIATPGSMSVVMTIDLDVQLAAGSSYANAARFVSEPFVVNGTKTITL